MGGVKWTDKEDLGQLKTWSVLVTILVAVAETPIKTSLREGGFLLNYDLRVWSITGEGGSDDWSYHVLNQEAER